MVDFDLSNIYSDIEVYKNLKIQKIYNRVDLRGTVFEFYNTNYSGKDYYHSLKYMGKTLMDNNPFEVLTNQRFFELSNGDILIFGLGFGWIIFPILNSSDIKSITVIESNIEIIEFVGDKLKNYDLNGKLNIIHGDVYEYHKENLNKKFDFIYFDIYDTPKLSIDDIDLLSPLYQKFLKEDGVIHFWCQEIRHLFS